jgi:hypothetical protein
MCSCKKNNKPINNLNNPDVIKLAQDIQESIILVKRYEDMDDFDKVEIRTVYSALYPNASAIPSVEDAINEINKAVTLYGQKR